MKVYYSLLLIFAVISGIKSDLLPFTSPKFCEDYTPFNSTEAYSRGFCRSLAFKSEGYAQCCFVKYKANDGTHYNCVPLTLGQYYDIDTAENDVKTVYGISDLDSLECTSSTYLYGSFLLLLFILF